MPTNIDRVDAWVMRYFVDHPNVKTTVEELSRYYQDDSKLESKRRNRSYSWQEVADYFMRSIAAHHTFNGRLTQTAPDPAFPATSPEYVYKLRYQVTPQGLAEFKNRLVSQQLIESGLAELAFRGALKAPLEDHTFAVHRDPHSRLWLTAKHDGGVKMCLLHAPPKETGSTNTVLTQEQWELAVALAQAD